MTSIGMRPEVGAGHGLQTSDATRRALLASGLVSSLFYAVIDLLAGLKYEGYSFYSQTISELGAIGAPKPPWLAPLFLTYCALMVVFAVAVLLEGRRSHNRLKFVGTLLLLYMLVGSGTSIFPMHARGTGTLEQDMPHIVAGLAATTVMVVTIGVASVTLGGRFGTFSWTMIGTMIVFGALTAPLGVKLAHGEPTPGMGVLERLAYYSMLTWVAGLSVALLRRVRKSETGGVP